MLRFNYRRVHERRTWLVFKKRALSMSHRNFLSPLRAFYVLKYNKRNSRTLSRFLLQYCMKHCSHLNRSLWGIKFTPVCAFNRYTPDKSVETEMLFRTRNMSVESETVWEFLLLIIIASSDNAPVTQFRYSVHQGSSFKILIMFCRKAGDAYALK